MANGVPLTTPKIIKVILGGIIGPTIDEVAVIAAANFYHNPLSP